MSRWQQWRRSKAGKGRKSDFQREFAAASEGVDATSLATFLREFSKEKR